jgi:hypothetical protein
MAAVNEVPPIDEQFISDALQLDPKPTAEEIAELWCDQQMEGNPTKTEFKAAVRYVTTQVKYYMPF